MPCGSESREKVKKSEGKLNYVNQTCSNNILTWKSTFDKKKIEFCHITGLMILPTEIYPFKTAAMSLPSGASSFSTGTPI